jgi:hypothetical protein
MAKIKYTDNAASLLTTTINNVDDPVTFSITASDGSKFPALSAGEWFPVVVIKSNQQYEKMKVTSRSGDSLTAVRAQGGSTKLSFNIGDAVYLGPTKEFMDEVLLTEDAQNGKPHYCGVAGGSANAITLAASPTLGAYVSGQILTFIALGTNSGAVTVNTDSLGIKNLKDASGAALGAGTLVAGGNYAIQYNGTAGEYRLISGFPPSNIAGNLTVNGQILALGGIDIFPKNSKMQFFNNAAPAGWTFDATFADKVVRCAPLVGDGAGTGGSWTISGLTHSHTHGINFNSGGLATGAETQALGQSPGINTVSASHTHTVIGNTGVASTSAVSSDGTWRPAYVNAIVCTMNRGP